MRTGTMTTPLRGGKAPYWLFNRMTLLSKEIISAIIFEFGTGELLMRLSEPLWFQALGCALGFDWHSSGVTTTVCGAIKEGIKGMECELGIFICGGKGGRSRKTPEEIGNFCEKISHDPAVFSFAHGGKDGTPYPVDRAGYDLSIDVLRTAVERAKIEDKDKLNAVKRLAELKWIY